MPLSNLAKLGLAAAALVGGNYWYKQRKAKRKKTKKGVGVPACLEGVWSARTSLIPEIYNNLNDAGKATADQFYGVHLTPEAQGALFESLAKIYVDDISVFVGDAALTAMSEIAPCDWAAPEWPGTMADAMESAEALAMVVLADIQEVVIPFEQPPVKIVTDPEADLCVVEIWVAEPQPLHGEILGGLKPASAAIAEGEGFHLPQEVQAEAFVHIAEMAVNQPDIWMTSPIDSTLRAIAPGCAWERKDHYTSKMADIWDDVEALVEIVQTDIM